jgi:hypothetical protein
MKRYLRIHPVSRIANGLSDNLKNIQKHRSLIQEEINDILGRLMFFTEGRSVAVSLTETKEEEGN